MMISIDSVSVTVAIASGPSFDTQKMSATANTDSMTISSTIGTASSRMARPSGSEVKSWRAPRSDSRTSDQNPSSLGATTGGDVAAAVSGGVIGGGSFTATTNDRPANRQARGENFGRPSPRPLPQAGEEKRIWSPRPAQRGGEDLVPSPRGAGRGLG